MTNVDVSKESKPKAKQAKKPAAKKAKPAKTAKAKRHEPNAKVTWTGKDNPFREGSGPWTRTETVRKASGQTVETIRAKPGLRATTLATLTRLGLIKVS